MYCPKCAAEVKSGIRYCNSCGYRLPSEPEKGSDSIAGSLTKAVGFIGVIGLISTIFLVKMLLESNVVQGLMIGIVALYLVTIFGICALCINYLKSLQGGRNSEVYDDYEQPKELGHPQQGRLEASRTPPASVTVDTTRTLDEVHLKKD